MGLFNKLLHAGEGRKLKLVETIVPEVSAFEPEMEARSDEALRAMTDEFRGRLAHCETKEERVEMRVALHHHHHRKGRHRAEG